MNKPENKYINQADSGELGITEDGLAYLEQVVTDTVDNVYSFNSQFSQTIIAASMARLSRFSGDMRELILKEFTVESDQESAVLRRILTQFGDDSVQQLSYVPVVVEGVSKLMTKQLEWGRLAAYLEQSTRYIYYDVKRQGRYRYYVPEHLPADLLIDYRKTMDLIFDNYSKVVRKMTDYYYENDTTLEADRDVAWRIAMRGKACDAARGLLPLATTSTVGIVGSAQAIDNMIMHLTSQELPESKIIGEKILREVRKQHAIFFERTDQENRGLATVAYKRQTRKRLEALASKLKAVQLATNLPPGAKLMDYWPKDELDLLPNMLYSNTNLSFNDLKNEVGTWSDKERQAAFDLYIGERGNRRHKPGRAIEKAHYTFELVCDYGAFCDLQRHRMVDGLEYQSISPNLGYDVPESVVTAGLNELYVSTHDLSLTLYQQMKKANYLQEAQYATLLSNKMRWQLTLNARSAFHFLELRTQPAGHIDYRKIAKQMHDEIAKVHPRLAKAMIFVDRKDDDPSSSRLEQARRAEAKLKMLGLDGLIE